MLCPSHSLLEVYAGRHLYVVYMNNMIHEIKSTLFCFVIYTDKHLYDKNLNNEQEESIRNQFSSVMNLQVPSVQDLCSELLRVI